MFIFLKGDMEKVLNPIYNSFIHSMVMVIKYLIQRKSIKEKKKKGNEYVGSIPKIDTMLLRSNQSPLSPHNHNHHHYTLQHSKFKFISSQHTHSYKSITELKENRTHSKIRYGHTAEIQDLRDTMRS
jgi:hypothetical protein